MSRLVESDLMTIADVARHCRVSTKTVRRWIERRELPATRLGGQWRIRPRDLEHFVLDRLER